MARPVLPTDFKDDVLAESMSGKRRYRIIQNADGTVSLDDVTDYEQVGSVFGAKQVNDMSSAVNSIEDVKAANNCTTTEPGFVLDARQGKTLMDKSNELSRDFAGGQMEIRLNSAGEGEYRKKGADSWIPFKRTPSLVAHGVGVSTTVLSRRYAATGNGYIMVAMSSWSNTALTFSVTKNGSSIPPSSQDGVADRNKYLYCYVFSILTGDNIVATVKSSNGKDAADLYLAIFAIV